MRRAWPLPLMRRKAQHIDFRVGPEKSTMNVWVLVHAINTQIMVLKRVLAGDEPVRAKNAVHTRPDGQVIVDVFPATGFDRLLLNGYKAQVWIEPGVSAEQTRAEAAALYRGTDPGDPEVCVVLGAGNLGTITALDIIDQLYIRGNVCAVESNPVNEYLGPFYEQIFSEFISRGWLRLLYGGADVGGYLARHPKVDTIHMSRLRDHLRRDRMGNRRSSRRPQSQQHAATEQANHRRTRRRQYLHRHTGDWGPRDLRFQAEHIATTKLINSGHNCNATQVLVLSEDWPLANRLVAEVRAVISDAEPRPAYYPGSKDRIADACRGMSGTESLGGDHTRALITDVDAHSGASIPVTDEVFAGVLGVVRLPGKTVEQFLHNAVEFANDVLPGSLGAVITIDPKTRKQNAQAFDDTVAHLRYGAVGINAWTGMAFALTTWGAFPGNTAQEHRQRHWHGTQHLLCSRDLQKAVRRDPVLSRAALGVERRTDPLSQASFLSHQQDSGNYPQTARTIPRPPQPHRTTADLPVCISR